MQTVEECASFHVLHQKLTIIENKIEHSFRLFRQHNFQITEEDRFHLATYIGLQIVRTPLYRNITKAVEYKLARDDIKRAVNGNDEGINFVSPDDFDDYALTFSLKIGIEFWSPLLFSGKWLFVVPSVDVKFITSDNPVALLNLNAKSKIDKNLQIWFPISLDSGLFIHYKDGPSEFVDSISDDVAKSFNSGILHTAQKYIFCSSQQVGIEILKSR